MDWLAGERAIEEAVKRLAAGHLVAFPTETVYGLGADAANPAAVARIFAAKGRPRDHPVILHVATATPLTHWAIEVPPQAYRLAARFWPGPLSVILKRGPRVSDAVTGGQDTVGLRCPAHPIAQRLLEACAAAGIQGLAAPSANRYGRISPTTAAHVRQDLGDEVALILDGGACEVGIESTIIDLSAARPRLLRPGRVSAEMLRAILEEEVEGPGGAELRVSGSHAAHYAPRTLLELCDASAFAARGARYLAQGIRLAALASRSRLAELLRAAPDHADLILQVAAPPTAEAYARSLYATLRALDESGAARILVEAPPAAPAWVAIHDRLGRAAAGSGKAVA